MKLKTKLLALLLLSALSAFAAWPKPQITYFNAATRLQVEEHVAQWRRIHETGFVSHSVGVSMRPWLLSSPNEWQLMERYHGQPLTPGMVIRFRRDAATPHCLHMIAAVSRSGWLYLSGLNNSRSDGWFAPSDVEAVLLEVVRLEGSQ